MNNKIIEHVLPERLLHDQISFLVVGAGGNGSQFVNGLARLHIALKGVGHPEGLHVTLIDPDRVTEANVGRQLFSPSDVGQYKAAALINRLNTYYGLGWGCFTDTFPPKPRPQWGLPRYDFIVGCVDSAAGRRSIHQYLAESHGMGSRYWLDLGNSARSGQVVLGECLGHSVNQDEAKKKQRLPFVTELFPELMDASIPEDDAPSCSLAEALGKQDLFINQAVSTFALQLLWQFFRHGRLSHHGYYVNLETGNTRPMPNDPATWARLMKSEPPTPKKVRRQKKPSRQKPQ